jgi:hypothetical protein
VDSVAFDQQHADHVRTVRKQGHWGGSVDADLLRLQQFLDDSQRQLESLQRPDPSQLQEQEAAKELAKL